MIKGHRAGGEGGISGIVELMNFLFRQFIRSALVVVLLAASAGLMPVRAVAAELGDQAQRLFSQYGIGPNGFSAVLIGKDGGEKLRVNDVPDLAAIYAVIDGMPMRGREMSAAPGRC